MPALRLKFTLWIGLLLALLLAVTPRPAAASVEDCTPEAGAAPRSLMESEEAAASDLLAAEPAGTSAKDPENAGNRARGAESPPPGGAHRPRTSWPELVPLGS